MNAATNLRDFEEIGPIVQQLAERDVTDNETVGFILENIEAAKQKAVEDGYRRANDSALAVAKSGGRTLGELSCASVGAMEQAQGQSRRRESLEFAPGAATDNLLPHKEAEYSAPTSEFSAQTIVVKAHIHAVFVLR